MPAGSNTRSSSPPSRSSAAFKSPVQTTASLLPGHQMAQSIIPNGGSQSRRNDSSSMSKILGSSLADRESPGGSPVLLPSVESQFAESVLVSSSQLSAMGLKGKFEMMGMDQTQLPHQLGGLAEKSPGPHGLHNFGKTSYMQTSPSQSLSAFFPVRSACFSQQH